MTMTTGMTALVGAGCLLLGWAVSEAQPEGSFTAVAWPPRPAAGAWTMLQGRQGFTPWLYNSRTGRVYRVKRKCPAGTPPEAGCLVPLPFLFDDVGYKYSPNP